MRILLYQEPPSFMKSCIPLTVEMSKILGVAVSSEEDWHDDDKLLVILDPSSKDLVNNFYNNDGPALDKIKTKEELELYDLALLQKLINTVDPTILDMRF